MKFPGPTRHALILGRALYELNLNLSKICGGKDPEADARRFVRFGKFELIRLRQKDLRDRLYDAQLKSKASVEITNWEKELADIAATLDRDFGEFRTAKGKWRKTWCGLNVEELARDIAKATGGQDGQSDYFVYKLGSLFTHNGAGSLFLKLPMGRETLGWDEFYAAIVEAGHKGLPEFLHDASICLVDIVGMAGNCIAEYEREWFDEIALPLLQKM